MRQVLDRTLLEFLEPRQLLATIAWDGGGGDNQWLNPLNWEGDVLPGASDTAVIAALPSAVVYAGGTTTVGAIQSASALDIHSGVLTAAGASTMDGVLHITGGALVTALWTQNGDFAFTAGILDGGGPFTVEGRTVWTGGIMAGTGKTVAHGEVEVAGTVELRRELNLYAAQDWSGVTVNMDAHGSVRLWPGAVLTMRNNSVLATSQGGAAYVGGTLRIRDSSVIADFYAGGQSARVDLLAGTFLVRGRGAIGAGVYTSAGTTLALEGDSQLTVLNGTQWQGDGAIRAQTNLDLRSSGLTIRRIEMTGEQNILLVSAPAAVRELVITDGAAIWGNSRLTVLSLFELRGGSLNSVVRIAPGAAAHLIECRNFGSLRGTLINDGVADLDPPVSSDEFFFEIENNGVLKQLSLGTATIRGLTGDGTVLVQRGMLDVRGWSSTTGQYAGTLQIAFGAWAHFRNSAGLAAGSLVIGGGTLRIGDNGPFSTLVAGEVQTSMDFFGKATVDRASFAAASIGVSPGAVVRLARDLTISSPFVWPGGEILGPGKLTVQGWKQFDVYGVTADATLSTLLINRSTMTFRSGKFVITSAGSLVNEGAVRLVDGLLVADGQFTGAGDVRKVGNPSFTLRGLGVSLDGTVEIKAGKLTTLAGLYRGAVTLADASCNLNIGEWETDLLTGSVFMAGVTGPGSINASWCRDAIIRGLVDVGRISIGDEGSLALWDPAPKHAASLIVSGIRSGGGLGIGARAHVSVDTAVIDFGGIGFDMSGPDEGQFGSLTVINQMQIGGSQALASVRLIGGYVPPAGLTADIINGPRAPGAFDSVHILGPHPANLNAELIYEPAVIQLHFVHT